jgi:hypothetical protein
MMPTRVAPLRNWRRAHLVVDRGDQHAAREEPAEHCPDQEQGDRDEQVGQIEQEAAQQIRGQSRVQREQRRDEGEHDDAPGEKPREDVRRARNPEALQRGRDAETRGAPVHMSRRQHPQGQAAGHHRAQAPDGKDAEAGQDIRQRVDGLDGKLLPRLAENGLQCLPHDLTPSPKRSGVSPSAYPFGGDAPHRSRRYGFADSNARQSLSSRSSTAAASLAATSRTNDATRPM